MPRRRGAPRRRRSSRALGRHPPAPPPAHGIDATVTSDASRHWFSTSERAVGIPVWRRCEALWADAWEACGMDGIHDLGGLDGFGPVDVEPDEPAFHEDWERRVFRLNMAAGMGVRPSGGAFRHSIERMDPAHYLSSSYYEHWLTGISTLVVEAGLVSREELDRRAGGRFPLSRPDRGSPPSGPEADHLV